MLQLNFSLQVVAHRVFKDFLFVCCVLIINDECLVKYVFRWRWIIPKFHDYTILILQSVCFRWTAWVCICMQVPNISCWFSWTLTWRTHCTAVVWYVFLRVERLQFCSQPNLLMTVTVKETLSSPGLINAHGHTAAQSRLRLCEARRSLIHFLPLRCRIVGVWNGALCEPLPTPTHTQTLFIRFSWRGAQVVWDLAGTLAPRCVDGPWASPRAGGPRRPTLSCRGATPAARVLPSRAGQTETSGAALHAARGGRRVL